MRSCIGLPGPLFWRYLSMHKIYTPGKFGTHRSADWHVGDNTFVSCYITNYRSTTIRSSGAKDADRQKTKNLEKKQVKRQTCTNKKTDKGQQRCPLKAMKQRQRPPKNDHNLWETQTAVSASSASLLELYYPPFPGTHRISASSTNETKIALHYSLNVENGMQRLCTPKALRPNSAWGATLKNYWTYGMMQTNCRLS